MSPLLNMDHDLALVYIWVGCHSIELYYLGNTSLWHLLYCNTVEQCTCQQLSNILDNWYNCI